MRQVGKRIVCIVLLGVLCIMGMSQTGKAAEFEAVDGNLLDSGAISVCAVYTEKLEVVLSISNEKAKIWAMVSGGASVSKIHAKLVLQKYSSGNWGKVKTYEDTVSASSYSTSRSKTVSRGKYRVKAVFTLYKGKKSEKVTRYSKTMAYVS